MRPTSRSRKLLNHLRETMLALISTSMTASTMPNRMAAALKSRSPPRLGWVAGGVAPSPMDEVTLAICRATDNVREGSGFLAEPVRLMVHYRSTARRARGGDEMTITARG